MSDVVIISIALMGILVFGLGANVTRHRAARGKAGGTQMPTDPTDPLLIAIRAHGNAAEYIPMLCVLLLVGSTLTDSWWLDALAVAAVVVRSAHAVGMLTSPTLASYGPFRSVGASGTYVVGIALGITAIVAM
jgi:uncharacterized membrane protein YecN with MAPEG domain